MKTSAKYIAQLIFITIITLSGCREEIVPPDNPAGNVNEPLQYRSGNTYTFIINAENISFNITDYTNLKNEKTRIYFYLGDYSSGSVHVALSNQNDALFYSNQFTRNLEGFSVELKGQPPSIIKITCQDFSGKLKIQLTSL